MNWEKILEALYGFIGALLGAWAASGCSLMGRGVGMTMHSTDRGGFAAVI
jgi:hypothetical protein